MKFIADECCDIDLVQALRADGHDVLYVIEFMRGSDDEQILQLSVDEARILITEDKDFGELVYRLRLPAHGIVLLRFNPEERESKIHRTRHLIEHYSERLPGRFVVVDAKKIRFRNLKQ